MKKTVAKKPASQQEIVTAIRTMGKRVARGRLRLKKFINKTGFEQIDVYRHFGLECTNVGELRKRLIAAGYATEDGRAAPWQRFFVRDPFGNRIEIHEAGGMRG